MSGAATSPEAAVFASAAAQVKKAIEITHRLGGVNYVFWGGREGYSTLLNTDVKRELDHMAALFWMAVKHAEKIGFKGQFLIEPKPKEPSSHQYDYDAQTVIGFLLKYGLDKHFKLNIEPNHTTLAGHRFVHDVHVASRLGFLGSIDCNTGSGDLGWDTDQFITNVQDATEMMLTVVKQGGIAPGGLNFDCKVRRESTDLRDIFIAHAAGMDTLALGLLRAWKIVQDGTIDKMVKARYSSYDSGLGKLIEEGKATFEDCEEYVKKHGHGQPKSGQEELYQLVVQRLTVE